MEVNVVQITVPELGSNAGLVGQSILVQWSSNSDLLQSTSIRTSIMKNFTASEHQKMIIHGQEVGLRKLTKTEIITNNAFLAHFQSNQGKVYENTKRK